MSLERFYQNEVITVNRNASIQETAKKMKEYNIGAIVVVENENQQKPCGILTDRDIVTKMFANEVDIFQISAGDVMCDDLLTLNQVKE